MSDNRFVAPRYTSCDAHKRLILLENQQNINRRSILFLEIEDPAYYRRKCRYVRKCRSTKKCSRVRIPVKYSGKGQYKKPRYQLRCKPVRRCRRVRVCRKVRVQLRYSYGK